MVNTQEIKAMWTDLNNRIAILEEENRRLARKVTGDKYRTIKDKLISKYKSFIILEIIVGICIPIIIIHNPETVEKYRWVTAGYYFFFFMLCMIVEFILLANVKKMDVYSSSVKEIAGIAAKNWKIHKLWIFLGLPFAIVAIILYALSLGAENYVIFGMIFGGTIGTVIGGIQLSKFMKYYKQLQSEDK